MEGKVLNYKLAWIDENDSSIMHSKMFETVEEAIKESEGKKDFMIFLLKKSEDGSYTWSVLPYGESNLYRAGIFIKHFLSKYKGYIFVGLGTLLAWKIAYSLEKQKK